MNSALALALALSSGVGAARYWRSARKSEDRRHAAGSKAGRRSDGRSTRRPRQRNEILGAQGAAAELEACWAAYRERTGDIRERAGRTGGASRQQRGADPAEMLPVRRILCKMGDSLNSWRRLVYQGFPAVTDPEIAPGIKALGDSPQRRLAGQAAGGAGGLGGTGAAGGTEAAPGAGPESLPQRGERLQPAPAAGGRGRGRRALAARRTYRGEETSLPGRFWARSKTWAKWTPSWCSTRATGRCP